jgi:CRISPR-associated protein Csx17
MINLELPGITATPVGNYLAALGLLHAVANAHPNTRGWWRDGEVFCLRSPFDAEGLLDYLQGSWEPAVLVRPWEPDPKQDEQTLKVLPDTWSHARDTLRFSVECVEMSAAIKLLRKQIAQKKKTLNAKSGTAGEKRRRLTSDPEYQRLLQESAIADQRLHRQGLRSNCPEHALGSFDASFVLSADGDTPVFGPLLGVGGSDGRRDFMLVYLRQLHQVLTKREQSRAWLKLALGFGSAERPPLPDVSGNSWFPDSIKIHNSGQSSFYSEHPASPWSYLLACEGIQILSGSSARRLGEASNSAAVFPFVLRRTSPASRDQADKDKAEFWAPLWDKPASLAEVELLFRQGRATLQGRSVVRPHQMGQALLGRGVQQGIRAFQRHTLVHTTSSNTFEAIPGWKFSVASGTAEMTHCLAELRPWEERLPRDTSSIVVGLRRRFEDAVLAVCEQPKEPVRWQNLLVTCSQIDLRLDRNKAYRKSQPVPPLSPRWLQFLIGDQSTTPEFAFSASVASIMGLQSHGGEKTWSPIRENIFSVETHRSREAGRTWAEFTKNPSNRVVWSGLDLLTDLSEVLRRRCLDSIINEPLGLGAAYSCPFDVLASFVSGQLDDAVIARLIPALSLLDWGRSKTDGVDLLAALPSRNNRSGTLGIPSPLFCLKPLFQTRNIRMTSGKRAFGTCPFPPRAPEVLACLLTGDLSKAVEDAERRLRICGLRTVSLAIHRFPYESSRRIAAATLVPWNAEQVRIGLERIIELTPQNN